MRFSVILSVLILFSLSLSKLNAQDKQLDIYYQALKEAEGPQKVEILLTIVEQLRPTDPAKALSTAKDALKLSKKIKTDFKFILHDICTIKNNKKWNL